MSHVSFAGLQIILCYLGFASIRLHGLSSAPFWFQIAHEVGADHDKEKDPSKPCWSGSNNVMAAHQGKARKGWSACTVRTFREYTTSYKNMSACKGCPKPPCDTELCGGYCLANHKSFDVAGASTVVPWTHSWLLQFLLVVGVTLLSKSRLFLLFLSS